MREEMSASVEVIDVAPGLWIWRVAHPSWNPDEDWQQVVTSICVDAGDERWVIDPLLPSAATTDLWERFAQRVPTAVATTIPDHVRATIDDPATLSIDLLVDKFGCRAFGPNSFDPDEPRPRSRVQRIVPGQELPGGLLPFPDPRGRDETPLWLPEQRTFVVGDLFTERNGQLRVWSSQFHAEHALPMLRAMLELPVERLIISHGEPIHTRSEIDAALELAPWPASSLHYAAYRGNLARVRELVGQGADLQARDERYAKTPLGWAELGGHRDVIAYLRSGSR